MDFLAIAGPATREVVRLTAPEAGGLTINVFWIIIGAANFILFFALFKMFFATPISGMLADRRARIEQGLSDAEAARAERESSAAERTATITDARREAKEIIDRAQKVAQETRDADIQAEKDRALADLRSEVADLALAAAGRVVGETMSDQRQRRLVEEFLRAPDGPKAAG